MLVLAAAAACTSCHLQGSSPGFAVGCHVMYMHILCAWARLCAPAAYRPLIVLAVKLLTWQLTLHLSLSAPPANDSPPCGPRTPPRPASALNRFGREASVSNLGGSGAGGPSAPPSLFGHAISQALSQNLSAMPSRAPSVAQSGGVGTRAYSQVLRGGGVSGLPLGPRGTNASQALTNVSGTSTEKDKDGGELAPQTSFGRDSAASRIGVRRATWVYVWHANVVLVATSAFFFVAAQSCRTVGGAGGRVCAAGKRGDGVRGQPCKPGWWCAAGQAMPARCPDACACLDALLACLHFEHADV